MCRKTSWVQSRVGRCSDMTQPANRPQRCSKFPFFLRFWEVFSAQQNLRLSPQLRLSLSPPLPWKTPVLVGPARDFASFELCVVCREFIFKSAMKNWVIIILCARSLTRARAYTLGTIFNWLCRWWIDSPNTKNVFYLLLPAPLRSVQRPSFFLPPLEPSPPAPWESAHCRKLNL